MLRDRLQSFALSLPHATVTRQWGDNLVFKVAGKMFLIVSLDGEMAEQLCFKCDPADYAWLTREIDGIVPATYNLYKSHWVLMEDPGALPEAELRTRLRRSYDLVKSGLPARVRAGLA